MPSTWKTTRTIDRAGHPSKVLTRNNQQGARPMASIFTSLERTLAAGLAVLVGNGERQLLGIATMHKSNMVPVFADNKQVAEDIARMRRG